MRVWPVQKRIWRSFPSNFPTIACSRTVQALEKLQRRAVILKSTNVQLHCRYTLSLLFGLATERRRAWEAGWDLGRRLAAGELNCPSSSSSSSIVSLSLSTTQSFPDHYCLGNFSKFFFAQATLSSCPTRTFSQRRTPSAKRSVGTRRAASMQDTLSEGTARATQLAPSAVTASAVGGSANRSVVGRVSPTTRSSSRSQ